MTKTAGYGTILDTAEGPAARGTGQAPIRIDRVGRPAGFTSRASRGRCKTQPQGRILLRRYLCAY